MGLEVVRTFGTYKHFLRLFMFLLVVAHHPRLAPRASPVVGLPDHCAPVCDCHRIAEEISVHCSHANLRSVPNFGTAAYNITNLDLSGNVFEILTRDTFPALPRLARLEMTDDGIIMMNERAFVNMPRLVFLELERNRLHYLESGMFDELHHLKSLSLGHNALKTIGARTFSGLRLEHLDLQNNADLRYVALNAFENTTLQLLNLDTCDLSSESLFALRPLHSTLRTLFLSQNKRKPLVIPPSLLWNFTLENLHVANDGLTDLSFLDAAVTVLRLDVSGNPLSSVDIGRWPGLLHTRVLIMSSCQLLTLNNSANIQLDNLEHLDLPNNLLSALNPRVFLRLRNLRRLDLRSNAIRVVSDVFLPVFEGLDYLGLRDNPLECDCRLEWMRKLLLRQEKRGILSEGVNCVKLNQTFLNASTEPFECTQPSGVDLQLRHVASASNVISVNIVCSAHGRPTPDLTVTQDSDSFPGVKVVKHPCSQNISLSQERDFKTHSCATADFPPVDAAATQRACVVFYCGAVNILGSLHVHANTCDWNLTEQIYHSNFEEIDFIKTSKVPITVSLTATFDAASTQHTSASRITAIVVTCVIVCLILCVVLFLVISCRRTGHVVRPTLLSHRTTHCVEGHGVSIVEEELTDSLSTTRLIVQGQPDEKDEL